LQEQEPDSDGHISFKSSSTEQEAQEKPEDLDKQLSKQLSEVQEYESEMSSNYVPRECRKLMTAAPAQSLNLSDIKEA